MLKYALVENVLAPTPSGYVALVSGQETIGLDAVIGYMISEGTGLTRPQAYAYFEKLVQSIEFFLGLGFRVVTPLVRIKPSIGGVFTGPDDNFDPSRHQINIRSSSGLRLLDYATKIKPEKVEIAPQEPVVRSFTDGVNKTMNTTAVSDSFGTILGKRLKFDESDNRLGIFFIQADDATNEIPMPGYLEVMPSKLHFRIPVLPAGSYKIVVRTLSRDGLNVLQGELKHRIRVD